MTVALLPHSWLPFTLDLTTWRGSPHLPSRVRWPLHHHSGSESTD
jgi:hypothetical protein